MKITEKCQDYLKRGFAFCLAPVFVMIIGGCAKDNEEPTFDSRPALVRVSAVGNYGTLAPISEYKLLGLGLSNVSESDLQRHNYDYIVDVEKLGVRNPDKKLQFFESFNLKSISSEKEDENAGLADYVYRHNSAKNPMPAYMLVNEKLLIPDCYAHYFFNDSEHTFRENLKVFKNMEWFYSEKILINNDIVNPLKLVYSRAEVKADISDFSNSELYTIDSLPLKQGDIMESYALYVMSDSGKTLELVGYMQIGAGSHSENIQAKNFGNLSSVIATVEKAFAIEDCKDISPEEFSDLQKQISASQIVDGVITDVGYSYSKK